MKISSARFISALHEAGFEPRSYSGRGMFGKSCVGVSVDSSTSSAAVACRVIRMLLQDIEVDEQKPPLDLMDEVYELAAAIDNIMTRTKEDALGLGSIFYWPSMPWSTFLEVPGEA